MNEDNIINNNNNSENINSKENLLLINNNKATSRDFNNEINDNRKIMNNIQEIK